MDQQAVLERIRTAGRHRPIFGLQAAIGEFGNSQVAKALGVHPAHISNLNRRGVSPTLTAALERAGVVAPPRRQYRRAALFGYGECGRTLAEAFDRWCERQGVGLTDWARGRAAEQIEWERRNGHIQINA